MLSDLTDNGNEAVMTQAFLLQTRE